MPFARGGCRIPVFVGLVLLLSMATGHAEEQRPGAKQASPPPSDLRARYASAIHRAVIVRWRAPLDLQGRCRILLTQSVGGHVGSVEIQPECDFPDSGRRSIEAAVQSASPLPYAGFEAVFEPRVALTFTSPHG